MKTHNYKFNDLQLNYDLSSIAPLEKILFLDIETTGFSPHTAHIYLIGVCYYRNGCWNGIQWLAQNKAEEERILKSFFQFTKGYDTLVHFNGNQFDLPFIKERIRHLKLDFSFDSFAGMDIYKRIFPCRHFLGLKSCRLKALEEFLGLEREDKYTGGELVSVYQEYVHHPLPELVDSLLIHNRDDLIGMLEILPVMAYSDLFNRPIKVHKVQSNHYKDYLGRKRQELMIHLKLPSPVPVPLSRHAFSCYFKCQEKSGILRVPVYMEELKYFYTDYKNYFYLPKEDTAIHKSVASFVEKSHRIPATASTCYTRKLSSYLPQWDYLFEPFFKKEYKSPLLYFELTDDFKTNREAFAAYAAHILTVLAKGEKRAKHTSKE